VTDAVREAQDRMQRAAGRGVTFTLRDGRAVVRNANRLWPEELKWFREHTADVVSALTPPPAPPPPQPAAGLFDPATAPQVYCPFLDRYVEEADVLEMLAGDGDDALAAYRDGRTPKVDAFRAARAWLKQRHRMEAADRMRHRRGRVPPWS
jgi:hypothetical protein